MQLWHDYFTHKQDLHVVNCTIKYCDNKYNEKHKVWCSDNIFW